MLKKYKGLVRNNMRAIEPCKWGFIVPPCALQDKEPATDWAERWSLSLEAAAPG